MLKSVESVGQQCPFRAAAEFEWDVVVKGVIQAKVERKSA